MHLGIKLKGKILCVSNWVKTLEKAMYIIYSQLSKKGEI